MSRQQKPQYKGDCLICPICLLKVKKAKEKRLPCQHILHKKCFERLKSKGHWRCPNCREPFTKRSQKFNYELKDENIQGLGLDQYVPTLERMGRRSYWDNLDLLPPLTPSGSDNSRKKQPQTHRVRELDSSRSCSPREREIIAHRPQNKEKSQPERPKVQQVHRKERRGLRSHHGNNRGRLGRSLSYLEDDDKESDEELYSQVLENLTEEPFFRFFSSNIVHEHEEREGIRWSRLRRDSPLPMGRSISGE